MTIILFIIVLLIITISYVKRKARNKILIKINQSKERIKPFQNASFNSTIKGDKSWSKELLRKLEWKRYEEVCTEYLKIKNCNAAVTCIGADGGIDIKITDKDGNLFAIGQCKSWNKAIGVNLIRELYGVMVSEKAEYALFFTTMGFSIDAMKFAQDKKIILIDENELIKLIKELNDIDKNKLHMIAVDGDYTTPTCVSCNTKMVKRIAKTGRNPGNEFWGCANYPKCKHKMFISTKTYQ
ncbi:restriction endonuclease [Methylobacter sp.]|uniref:restriction endonuclease n=1 Tax=Methylobacter sp. TaxID=2051955 RepID=UPI002FDC7AF9